MSEIAEPVHAPEIPATLNPAWYMSNVLPVLDSLPDLALGSPDRRGCEELYGRLFKLADDIRAIGEALEGSRVAGVVGAKEAERIAL